jgi:hypothetical protein
MGDSMKKILVSFIYISVFTFLVACTNEETLKTEPKQWQVGGDVREITSSIEQLPTMLDKKDDSIKEVYLLAAQHPELLSYMPCYCGCSISAGHKDNASCFYSEIREDGSIVWDNHGAKCMICLEIAEKSVAMYDEGKSMADIRTTIDMFYSDKGYSDPTDTKMPNK